ncbi:MAG: hypothetical protein ACR5LG_05265 [Sodalis sp. (in: enterobacteria)]
MNTLVPIAAARFTLSLVRALQGMRPALNQDIALGERFLQP